jgi:hypothetical protein
MELSKISACGRPVDMRYPTNRAILLITFVVMIVNLFIIRLLGIAWGESLRLAAAMAVGVFLSWALAREICPDEEYGAFVGIVVTIAGYWLLSAGNLLVLVLMLFLLRQINRSTGLSPAVLDIVIMIGLASWLAIQVHWVYALIAAVSFVMDTLLPKPNRRAYLFSGILIAVGSSEILMGGLSSGNTYSWFFAVLILAGLLPFLPLYNASKQVAALGDQTGLALHPARVRAAQIFCAGTILLAWLLAGDAGFIAVFPLWAGLLGLGIFDISKRILSQKKISG